MTLVVFWTVGCRFEGEQAGLVESWFVKYPGSVKFRIGFLQSAEFRCQTITQTNVRCAFHAYSRLLHFFQLEIAESGWRQEADGRIASRKKLQITVKKKYIL
ncbi:hypothetical protein V7S43_013385 [Phytophthora oleae]|uniref:Uncharacterized protein n=1 Tax=Phytophthora oleae TaxID=2107226 RepID=A0ABD3F539_9STRA